MSSDTTSCIAVPFKDDCVERSICKKEATAGSRWCADHEGFDKTQLEVYKRIAVPYKDMDLELLVSNSICVETVKAAAFVMMRYYYYIASELTNRQKFDDCHEDARNREVIDYLENRFELLSDYVVELSVRMDNLKSEENQKLAAGYTSRQNSKGTSNKLAKGAQDKEDNEALSKAMQSKLAITQINEENQTRLYLEAISDYQRRMTTRMTTIRQLLWSHPLYQTWTQIYIASIPGWTEVDDLYLVQEFITSLHEQVETAQDQPGNQTMMDLMEPLHYTPRGSRPHILTMELVIKLFSDQQMRIMSTWMIAGITYILDHIENPAGGLEQVTARNMHQKLQFIGNILHCRSIANLVNEKILKQYFLRHLQQGWLSKDRNYDECCPTKRLFADQK